MTDSVLTDPVMMAGAEAPAAPPPVVKLSAGLKATAGAGQLVESVSTSVVTTFLFFYYTALLGMPGSLFGLATFISLLVDALIDPLLGSWSDSVRTRWGRRAPFMLAGAPMVAFGLGLVFTPPAGLPTGALFAWLLGMSLLLRFGVSAFHVPFTALGAEMSRDYVERSSIVAYRTPFSILGPMGMLFLAYVVFLGGPLSIRRIDGYAPLAWTAATLILIGGLVGVAGARRFGAGETLAPASGGGILRRFVGEVREIFANPSFRVLFACLMLFFVAQGVAGNLGQYMNLFVWKVSSQQILLITVVLFVGFAVGVPIAPALARRMEKRDVAMLGLAMLCLAQGGLPALRALHLVTFSGAAAVPPIGLNTFFAGVGVTLATISLVSMLADSADEHDFLFAARREGLYFAGLSFAAKAASGVGSLIAGVALDLIRFPKMAASAGGAAHVTPGAVDNLIWVAGPLVALVSLAATSLLLFYQIDRARHAQVTEALSRRANTGS